MNVETDPVVEAAEAVAEEAESTGEPTETAPEEQVSERPKQDARDKELAYLRRRAEKADREQRDLNRRLAEENAALKAQMQQPQRPSGPPKMADYQDHDAYLNDLTDWKVEQRLAEAQQHQRHQQAQQHRQTQAQQMQSDLAARWQDLAEQGAEEYPDFEAVAYDFDQTDTMVHAIASSEVGHRIAHHLGTHPQEAAKISRLTPVAQAKAIGRLEARLAEKPKPRTTTAPEPPSRVTGGGGGETPVTPYTAQSFDEYRAAREKQQARRR